MHIDLQHLMTEATRLTQAGDLRAATAALQSALWRGASAPAGAASTFGGQPTGQAASQAARGEVIDVVARDS